MKTKTTLTQYQGLAHLMREIQLTASAIACHIETRSENLPLSQEWVGSRIDYLDVKLQAASEELNGCRAESRHGIERENS